MFGDLGGGAVAGLIVGLLVVVVVLVTLAKAVRIVPQARSGIVERLGRYNRTLVPGLSLLIPDIDRLTPLVDMASSAAQLERRVARALVLADCSQANRVRRNKTSRNAER